MIENTRYMKREKNHNFLEYNKNTQIFIKRSNQKKKKSFPINFETSISLLKNGSPFADLRYILSI